MKIIALSDLHVDSNNTTWANRSLKICEKVASLEADVLLFGGDMAASYNPNNPNDSMNQAFKILGQFKGTKLWYAGNNDLETLKTSSLDQYFQELHVRFQTHGFHLLDKEPVVIEDIGFMGNVGWYDSSFFDILPNHETNPNFPKNLHDARQRAEHYFSTMEFAGIVNEGFTSEDFFLQCWNKLKQDAKKLQVDPKVNSIVVGTHFVGADKFIQYGENPKYDYYNLFMGSRSFAQIYNHSKVSLALVGHTHRDDNHLVGNQRVFNISSTSRQPYNEFELIKSADQYKIIWTIPRGDLK
jgi:Icc-related predicted phosphoesterase